MTSLPDSVLNAPSSLRDRIAHLQDRIALAAERAGRGPQTVKLMAVTKTVPPERVREAALAGIRLFGENYVQEARAKIPAVLTGAVPLDLEFHLIGHLQSNKVRFCPRLFSMVQTIDSDALAEELNSAASKQAQTPSRVLVEVDLSLDQSRAGVAPDEALDLCARIVAAAPALSLEGLMGIAPRDADPEQVRGSFRRLRSLWDQLPRRNRQILSIGMSADFEVAIEEGSTLVRIGTALFGERPPVR